jgi:hypothetical protein
MEKTVETPSTCYRRTSIENLDNPRIGENFIADTITI